MNEYEIELNGIKHTLQLDAEDAKKYEGAKKVGSAKAAEEPANKSRTTKNK
jgi:hypothetical protein